MSTTFRNMVRSTKTPRRFLEQTIGEIVLEASMLGAGCMINPLFATDADESGPPQAVVMVATGNCAKEVLDAYVLVVQAARDRAAAEVNDTPLFQDQKADEPAKDGPSADAGGDQ